MKLLPQCWRRVLFFWALPLNFLLSACDNPAPGEGMPKPLAEGPQPKVVPIAQALDSPDLTVLDPGTLDQAEIDKVLPPGPRCSFAYTAESPPILVSTTTRGVVKLHGYLVEVAAQSVQDLQSLAQGATFTADGLRLSVRPEGEDIKARRVANLEFELEQGLLVGYRGWYVCGD